MIMSSAAGSAPSSGGGGASGIASTVSVTGIVNVTFPVQNAIGITGPVGVTFGVAQVTFPVQDAIGITGPVGVTFGAINGNVGISGFVGVTFGPVGISGVPSVTFGVVGNTGAIGITGSVGVTFGTVTVASPIGLTGAIGITGPVGVTFGAISGIVGNTGAIGITGSVGVTFGAATTIPGTTTISGSISANGGTFSIGNDGFANIGIDVRGTWTGTLAFEASNDGTNYSSIYAVPDTGAIALTTAANGRWHVALSAANSFRLRATTWTSGTASIILIGSPSAHLVECISSSAVNFAVSAAQLSGWTVGLVGPVGISGVPSVTFGVVGLTGAVGITGPVTVNSPIGMTGAIGITGSVGVTFGAINGNVGISGFVGVTFGPVGISGVPSITFGVVANTGAIGITGSVGVTLGTNGIPPIPSGSVLGTSVARSTALGISAVAIKASAGNLYGFHLANGATNATDVWVHFYNIAAASVTVGTSSPTRSYFIPQGGLLDTPYAIPANFTTAISMAAATTVSGSSPPIGIVYAHAEYL